MTCVKAANLIFPTLKDPCLRTGDVYENAVRMGLTECSMLTQKVSPRKKGLPSSSTRLNSSVSPSAIAPMDFCVRTRTCQ